MAYAGLDRASVGVAKRFASNEAGHSVAVWHWAAADNVSGPAACRDTYSDG